MKNKNQATTPRLKQREEEKLNQLLSILKTASKSMMTADKAVMWVLPTPKEIAFRKDCRMK